MDERKSAWSEATSRTHPPLGRGLEEVSHVFLSQRNGGQRDGRVKEEPAGPADEEPTPPPVPRPAPTLLRAKTELTRAQLLATLRELAGGLEEGLRVIDEGVPCPPSGDMDLLALDRGNHLVLIEFDTIVNDGLLMRGMGHADWIVRNLPNVRRMYTGRVINFSAPPRVFLLAPDFSPVFRRVVQLIPHVECVRYHVVDVGAGAGVLFERAEEV